MNEVNDKTNNAHKGIYPKAEYLLPSGAKPIALVGEIYMD